MDRNTGKDKFAVILTMLDLAQAFERQSHYHGIASFIRNGVRPSLIPILISFFQERSIIVKWKGFFSSPRVVAGGGSQGISAGIIEYLSQTSGCLSFIPEDEAWRFVDDSSFVEIVNLTMVGLSSYNAKLQVLLDIATDNYFLPPANLRTQDYLNRIHKWTETKEMKLNDLKTKYMMIDFFLLHSSKIDS